MKESAEVWILKGYEIFALYGESGLKVERLSKGVGINKSSFYHHFSDLDFFIEKLMNYHIVRSKLIAEKERLATTINPELISILTEHKMDLLFNRQLRISSFNSNYNATLLKVNEIIGTDFIRLWLADTGLNITIKQAGAVFGLALENFFLQINQQNLTRPWLEAYFEQLKQITRNFET